MRGHDLIVVGASAGGVEALMTLAGGLPAALSAAVCVVLHLPPSGHSRLPELLSRAGPLPAGHAEDGAPLRRGRIYVAPPDHHLLIERGRVRLSRGPRENRSRPAIDPLFRSAALAYGPRVVGVVLSGALADGAAGLLTVKSRGGVAIVQDPDEAAFAGMPRSALKRVTVDEVLPAAEMGPALARLAGTRAAQEGGEPVPDELEQEVETAAFEAPELQGLEPLGIPSGFSCPECHGVLYEIREGDLVRYRCRVGHAFNIESLHAGQADAVEDALWMAMRALEEKADLSRRLQRTAEERDLAVMSRRYAEEVDDALRRANVLRRLLLAEPTSSELPEEEAGA